MLDKANVILHQGSIDGSWNDPSFRIAAKNYPKRLDGGFSDMAGIDFVLQQQIALTNRYGNIKKSMFHISESIKKKAEDQKQSLIKKLWGNAYL